MAKISVIVPCYNEEESLPFFYNEIEKIRPQIPTDFEYIFVNDGSKDETLKILRKLNLENPELVHYINLSRNFGKEAAMYAGLSEATGDYVTLMDADLQDPPETLIEMYHILQDPDVDCVAARRSDRKGEPWLRSFFSHLFYKIMNKISETPVIDGVRDFRLMKRPMADAVLDLAEYNRFSKGLFTWVGFNTEYVAYENRERVAGDTHWNFFRLLKYSIDGFINFSEAPLNLAVYFGLFVVFVDIIAVIFVIGRAIFWRDPVSGWASTVTIMLFAFGVTLLMLGIIGKYIAKIFSEVKGRPVFIIKEKK
ncbi:glycosyltransferase family 2 protein [Lactovum miscens]|uniref:Glycosyltransferase involved in cell wall biosynthesis n=1 Tax=Lactovum miscens TaxID=190387 RepID=A0A841CA05_9LACT|nr:glycosyltransferase family 2 protein [Lactovum miscens]MBB5888020.1 glycosyltransferase involved in cell wall biosynthesis [Lactovum miscens]